MRTFGVLAVTAVATVLAACGDAPAPAASSKPAPTTASSSSSSSSGSFAAPATNTTDSTSTEPTTVCATGQFEAARSPANVLFLYDRSGSMHIVLPSNQTRWQAAEAGLSQLLEGLPSSVSAGLMMFPQGDAPVNQYCGIDASINDVTCKSGWPEPPETDRCDATLYQPNVASASLDATQVSALETAIHSSDNDFYWGTPLASALTAAIAAQRASTLPGPKSVILVTDGNPTSCSDVGISNDISYVVAAAQNGVDPTQGDVVKTYVIGLTDSSRQAAKASNLSPIAVAGGTARAAGCEDDDSCFYKLTDATFATDLAGTFDAISRANLSCTFDMPAATANEDPDKVNVDVNGTTIGRDASHQNGWDYVDGTAQVQLFGDACTTMQDLTAKLQIVVGCKTGVIK